MMWGKLRLGQSVFAASCLTLALSGCAEDPFDFGGPRSCEVADQNEWLLSLMEQAYLWSDDFPEADPLDYAEPEEFIRALRVEQDRWSRVADKATTDALFKEGKSIGFGFKSRRDDDGLLRVASVHPDSPAGKAGLKRGDHVLAIGGVTIEQLDESDGWDDVYGEKEPGVSVQFEITDQNQEDTRDVVITKDWVDIVTVPTSTVVEHDGKNIGYFVFATFVDTAYDELDETFAMFNDSGVRHVIVDLRYNSGGRIAVARRIIDLLVGNKASGETSYQIKYGPGLDDQNSSRDISRKEHTIEDIKSVTFITTGTSISASELVINGVSPYVKTNIVGGKTGGKPVGSKQWGFCDKVAMPITFRILNGEGVGDYFDGMEPDCGAADDLHSALGNANEGMLAEALTLISSGSCSPSSEEEPPPESHTHPVRKGPPNLHGTDALIGWF